MRKIESQMCAAVQSNIDWKSGNTEVTIDKETNTSSVYLHGNLIATVTDNDMTIYDGGWQSNTTKSRLNALCTEFVSLAKVSSRKTLHGTFVSLSDVSTVKMSSRPKILNLVTSLPEGFVPLFYVFHRTLH